VKERVTLQITLLYDIVYDWVNNWNFFSCGHLEQNLRGFIEIESKCKMRLSQKKIREEKTQVPSPTRMS
jgi:hypothetical protein